MCKSCNVLRINGHLCHEHGCTESWRDEVRECAECGCDFEPSDNYQDTCNDCITGAFVDNPACPMCDNDGELMGILGKTLHFRCHACGMVFSESGQGALGLLIPLAFVAVIIAYLLTQINGGLFAQLLGGL